MKTNKRFKQHKIRLQSIRKQLEPQQQYRLGTISNEYKITGGGGGFIRFTRP